MINNYSEIQMNPEWTHIMNNLQFGLEIRIFRFDPLVHV